MKQQYLEDTKFLDFNNPFFDKYLENFVKPDSELELAIGLYNKVRNDFFYNPFHLDLRPEALVASNILTKRKAWCVEKSIVLAACYRKFGLPSKLGYAIVSNHIGTEKLEFHLRRKEIVFHGYVSVFLNDNWVKCTPAFDDRLCRITNVNPLIFDGKNDSMFQEYSQGLKFMEYIHHYGEFADVPIELMNSEMKKYYPHLFEKEHKSSEFSFRHM